MNLNEWHLRFSITPVCNFSCVYCNPEGLKEERETLSEGDIIEICKAVSELGINRVHWTGGEPALLDLERIIKETKKLGFQEQILTTNGSKGGRYIEKLIKAGLTRLIVSLDSIDPDRNYKITGNKSLLRTISSIETGVSLLKSPTKMNIVSMSKTSEEIPLLIDFASKLNADKSNKGSLVLKVIELCQNNPVFYSETGDGLYKDSHISRQNIMRAFETQGKLIDTKVEGDNPNADYYAINNTGVKVGFVTMPSLDYRCGGDACKKLRINPFGYSGVCIGMKPVKLAGLGNDEMVERLNSLLDYRDRLSIEKLDRKHFNDNFGFWRFGLCERNK